MKNRKAMWILAAAALPAMISCSSHEEQLSGPADSGNAIRFAASTDNVRSNDLTTNNLKSFNVYAYTGGNIFMDNVLVTKTGTNSWTYSPLQYWPADQSVDFYAYAPSGWVGSGGPLKPVPYNNVNSSQDLIYSVLPGMQGHSDTANAQVVFNFRHALAKVTVKLRSSDENLQVKVTNVAFSNIKSQGNFHFPKSATTGGVTADNVGWWTDQSAPYPIIFHMSQDASDVITLTTTPTDMSDTGLGVGGEKYLLPQLLSYRSGGSGVDNYLAVMCSVYDAKTGAKLWPNANTPSENVVEGSTFGDGLLKFPLSTTTFTSWEPGNHYIYNVTINTNEDMGAIEFGTPTVDTYVDVTTNY